MKKLVLWMGLMALLIAPASKGVLVESDTFDFVSGGDTVSVLSEVDLDGGIYTYSYKITSTDLYVVNMAIQLLPGSNVDPLSLNTELDGGVIPSLWQVTSSPLMATATFSTLVNPASVSDTLYLESDQAPTTGTALISGMTANFGFTSADGRVFTPIPEPATMALLAVGAVFLMRKQRV